MRIKTEKNELEARLANFIAGMHKTHPGWDSVFILSNVNQFYLTGTMQDGFLIIKSDGSAVYYVYRSYRRAADESAFTDIYPIKSYAEAASRSGRDCGETFFETMTVPYGIIERMSGYFDFGAVHGCDGVMLMTRAVKSAFELDKIKRAAEIDSEFSLNTLSYLFREGMSEAELYTDIYREMLRSGSQGIARASSFKTEMSVGRICFGESSIYPASMDSPNGSYGLSAAVPFIGSRDRRLKKGDLIFIDLSFGYEGYHTDRTQVFIYGEKPCAEAAAAHKECLRILADTSERLKEGEIPSKIYEDMTGGLSDEFRKDFMGHGAEAVRFLGHGVGLNIDEMPVIAARFNVPLISGMTVALEPKKGIEGIGMVGAEETYIVTPEGGERVTGGAKDIVQI